MKARLRLRLRLRCCETTVWRELKKAWFSFKRSILEQVGFTYDALDRRIAKTVDADGAGAGSSVTTYTVYDGHHAWADYDSSGTVLARYLFGDRIDEIVARWTSADGTAWYLTDHLGSVRDLVDDAGDLLNTITYDSFGNIIAQTNAVAGDRFTYTGREYDSELDLYYYRARFYDPALGRFVSQDPIGFAAGDANLYRYVGNAILQYIDPYGLDWLDAAANFSAGFGDTLSLGLTDLLRERVFHTNGGIDRGGAAYRTGVAVEIAGELAVTAGGSALRQAAAKAAAKAGSNQALGAAARHAARSIGGPKPANTVRHHINTLFGHPAMKGVPNRLSRYPSAGLPASLYNHPLNLMDVSRGMHNLLHRRAAIFEDILHHGTNRLLTAARAARALAAQLGLDSLDGLFGDPSAMPQAKK